MTDIAALDAADPLRRFRSEFHLPRGQIYLDGNSLGPLSRRAESTLLQVIDSWRERGIGGWTEGESPWIDLGQRLTEKLGPLLGASPDDIAVTGQTTVNLHQLFATLYDPHRTDRTVVVMDSLAFPSDRFALQSHLALHGRPTSALREIVSRDGFTLDPADIVASFQPDVQCVLLPSVIYTSGQSLPLSEITREAHRRGILIGWDLAHGIGSVPYSLGVEEGPDFAVWCHYKWLNAGPGAVGGLFLHPRHSARAPGLTGWWGVQRDRRFRFGTEFDPAPGAERLQIGTPHLLSMAPLLGSLQMVEEAGGMTPLRAKSLALTGLLRERIEAHPALQELRVVTPRADDARGGHLAVAHPEAGRICQCLRRAGVVPDFRPPHLIRLAPAPLYTSFADITEVVNQLVACVADRKYSTLSHESGLIP